jgi:hypothetical protein
MEIPMKPYHSIVVTILLVLLAGCATTSTPQFRQVSSEEAFSEIRALAKDTSQSHPEWERLYTQPVNKSVPCKLYTSQDQLDRNNFRAYWDGECKDGFAYGLGRDIAISDTHHVEQISIYGDNGKTINSPFVLYDFVHQTVMYGLIDDKEVPQYTLEEQTTNEGGKFHVKYSLRENTKNGYDVAIWSPLSNTSIIASDSENVGYKYTINKVTINNRTPTLLFETVTNKGSPIGFAVAKYANGQFGHFKVNNGEPVELVELPKEYLSMVVKKNQELLEFNSRASNKIEKAKRMEKEYLYRACNGNHGISGLEKRVSNKICTWRDQFKEPFELALNRFNESLEKMKAEAETQAEQQRIQEQRHQRRMAEAAELEAIESANTMNGMEFAVGLLNAFADGFNGTSNTYRYEPPTSSYNSNTSSGYTPSYNSNAPSGYTSSTGSTYEYDLSNPSDRVRYGADPAAKLRDRIDVNPQRRIERNTGQHGGGVLNNNNSTQWNWVD